MALRDPRLRRLRRRPVPAWWRDAKLGIFVHWTPASVPAFAPVDAEIGELLQSEEPDALSRSPYSEW
jgi:alpha-L-fucosidase